MPRECITYIGIPNLEDFLMNIPVGPDEDIQVTFQHSEEIEQEEATDV